MAIAKANSKDLRSSLTPSLIFRPSKNPVRTRPLKSRAKMASKKLRMVRFFAPREDLVATSWYMSMGRKEVSVINMPASAVLLAITMATRPTIIKISKMANIGLIPAQTSQIAAPVKLRMKPQTATGSSWS